jgi:prolyl 4-hydroxylase
MAGAETNAAADAAHLMARRCAEGAGVLQNWNEALDHLAHAAELGSAAAHAELAALARDWPLAEALLAGETRPPATARDLRGRIDIATFLKPGVRKIVSAAPRIAALEEFCDPNICRWLVGRAEPKLQPAKIYNPLTGGSGHESVRDNSECHFPRDEADLVLLTLRARIAQATEVPIAGMEATAILHYRPGQQFKPHFDFFDTRHPGYAKVVAETGQRVVTFLLCLNDDYEGGATEFPAVGMRFKGKMGSAIFFWNVTPHGVPDRQTVHAGSPTTRGEKWLLSQWIRVRG